MFKKLLYLYFTVENSTKDESDKLVKKGKVYFVDITGSEIQVK